MSRPEPSNRFEQYMMDTIDNLKKTLDDHNAQTADIANDVKDLNQSKWMIYGALGLISIIGTVVSIYVTLFK